jgi:hypothetical protein
MKNIKDAIRDHLNIHRSLADEVDIIKDMLEKVRVGGYRTEVTDGGNKVTIDKQLYEQALLKRLSERAALLAQVEKKIGAIGSLMGIEE